MQQIDLLLRALRPVGQQWQIDLADVACDQSADDGLVAFEHLAILESHAEHTLQVGAARQQQQARGCHVEPVHDPRIGELHLHACRSAVGLVGAPARHRQQPGGLVDDDQRVIDMHHRQRSR